MKLQQGASSIEIARIKIVPVDRQRQHSRDAQGRLTEVQDLESSISRYGMLNPILIEPLPDDPEFDFLLKAGERRITACQNLGQQKILARKVSDLSPVESQLIELEENIKRKDLQWQDLVAGVAKIHSLYSDLDPDWTMAETGEACGLSVGIVSMYLSVFNEISEERVRNASTVREAYNMLQRRSQRQAGVALQELLETPDFVAPEVRKDLSEEESKQVKALQELSQPIPQHLMTMARPKPAVKTAEPPDSILQASFLEWAPQYSGPKFNLVHCDFPYGVELFSGPQGRGAEPGQDGKIGYADAPSTYMGLLECFCTHLNRFMSNSAHLMFWMSADTKIVAQTLGVFAELAPTLHFHKFPLIWVKSDNAGIASDPRHGPRHVYEFCLLASRGTRQIAKVKGDAYSAPTDKKLHPSTKPEPMLRHFMEMLVDESTSLLDPTCGSGASLRAAESLGASRVLGLEIDRQFIDPARLALKQARAKKAAERLEVL